jgi:hypothetical protein
MLWEMDQQDLLVFATIVSCSTFLCGWVADRIAGMSAFTVIGNWLLLMIGSVLGLLLQNYLGYRFNWYPGITLAVFFGSGLFMLVMMMSIKRLAHA